MSQSSKKKLSSTKGSNGVSGKQKSIRSFFESKTAKKESSCKDTIQPICKEMECVDDECGTHVADSEKVTSSPQKKLLPSIPSASSPQPILQSKSSVLNVASSVPTDSSQPTSSSSVPQPKTALSRKHESFNSLIVSHTQDSSLNNTKDCQSLKRRRLRKTVQDSDESEEDILEEVTFKKDTTLSLTEVDSQSLRIEMKCSKQERIHSLHGTATIEAVSQKKDSQQLQSKKIGNEKLLTPTKKMSTSCTKSVVVKENSTTKEKLVENKREEKGNKKVIDEQKDTPGNSNDSDSKDVQLSIPKNWKPGERVPYAALANVFAKIESNSSRLVIQKLLTDLFRTILTLTPNDLLPCIYLCVCTNLAPPFKGVQIGVGDSLLMKAIGEATGAKASFVKLQYEKEGDLGKVADKSRCSQKTLGFIQPKSLTLVRVYEDFLKIADVKGGKSQDKKVSIIKGLLVCCKNDEACYVIRGLQGKLRIGLAEKTILIALCYALLDEKASPQEKESALEIVKQAYSECPTYDILVPALIEVGIKNLSEKCHLSPGIPVSPMLARPTKSYSVVFDRFVNLSFTCEYKYDGERAQIHILENGTVSIFSRNFDDSTEKYPDVIAYVKSAQIDTSSSIIIDSEIVAYDKQQNKRLPFQVLSTRSRKNVSMDDIKVQVCVYCFDVLYSNGKSCLGMPLIDRRALLRKTFKEVPGTFEFASSIDVLSSDEEDIEAKVEILQNYLQQSVVDNCEGLMVKTLKMEATYEPAKRSHKWLKLKKDYLDGIGDTVDLVPLGAFHGRGKRTGVYGAYLLGCYDDETETFQLVTKLGTGLSDDRLKEFHDQLQQNKISAPRSDYQIGDGFSPDVWFDAVHVWEILGADLSISPKYTAAMGKVAKDKGISLRFPRFVRLREDKGPTEATTAEQIADLYNAQGLANNNDDMDMDDEDAL